MCDSVDLYVFKSHSHAQDKTIHKSIYIAFEENLLDNKCFSVM